MFSIFQNWRQRKGCSKIIGNWFDLDNGINLLSMEYIDDRITYFSDMKVSVLMIIAKITMVPENK